MPEREPGDAEELRSYGIASCFYFNMSYTRDRLLFFCHAHHPQHHSPRNQLARRKHGLIKEKDSRQSVLVGSEHDVLYAQDERTRCSVLSWLCCRRGVVGSHMQGVVSTLPGGLKIPE